MKKEASENEMSTYVQEEDEELPLTKKIPKNFNITENNKTIDWQNFKKLLKMGKYYIFNITIVYYLEYVIQTGFGERTTYEFTPPYKN